MLAKTKKKLKEASSTIDQAEVRTRAIERKLKKVQEIPEADGVELNVGSPMTEEELCDKS